jgi:hypothetical protein
MHFLELASVGELAVSIFADPTNKRIFLEHHLIPLSDDDALDHIFSPITTLDLVLMIYLPIIRYYLHDQVNTVVLVGWLTYNDHTEEEQDMQNVHPLFVDFIDRNHAIVIDPNTERSFNVTTQPKTNMFVGGNPVKPRLYIGGNLVREKEAELGHRKAVAWAKDYFGPTLSLLLKKDVEIKFSAKAGCQCGCSPGFIIQDPSISFDIWMDAR